jgi:hypothetical protein
MRKSQQKRSIFMAPAPFLFRKTPHPPRLIRHARINIHYLFHPPQAEEAACGLHPFLENE